MSGSSVSMSDDGTSLIVGAAGNDANATDANANIGHFHCYKFNETDRIYAQFGFDIDGESAYDQSGATVSISGAPSSDASKYTCKFWARSRI